MLKILQLLSAQIVSHLREPSNHIVHVTNATINNALSARLGPFGEIFILINFALSARKNPVNEEQIISMKGNLS